MSQSRRTRKIVDYSKFQCDDSDDDFLDSNPSKKSKTEKLPTKTRSESNNVENKATVEEVPHTVSSLLASPALSSSSSSSSSSSKKCHSTNKENTGLNSDSETSKNVSYSDNQPIEKVDPNMKKSHVNDLLIEADSIVEVCGLPSGCDVNAIKVTEECKMTGRIVKESIKAESMCDHRMRCITPKWNPPSATPHRLKTDVQSPASISSGLRLGLSRSAKVKSLHNNVKP